jgi:putative transposase
MPRQPRHIRPGLHDHVLNRSAGRIALFRHDSDYAAFERIMLQAAERFPLPIVDGCLMPNHCHFVVCPQTQSDLTEFFRWLTHTHAMRWRVAHQTVGWGHLYQGRFKAFPAQEGNPLRSVRRYVQRNALTAGIVNRAEHWRWGSLWVREQGPPELRTLLANAAPRLMTGWKDWVNQPLTRKELGRLRLSVTRGAPFGNEAWVTRTARELNLQHTLRPEGRPPKEKR